MNEITCIFSHKNLNYQGNHKKKTYIIKVNVEIIMRNLYIICFLYFNVYLRIWCIAMDTKYGIFF